MSVTWKFCIPRRPPLPFLPPSFLGSSILPTTLLMIHLTSLKFNLTKVLILSFVGNGEHLPIFHFGKSSVSSSHGFLSLQDMLCVSATKKNLLSIRPFCCDNNCYFEMDNCVFVWRTREQDKYVLMGTTMAIFTILELLLTSLLSLCSIANGQPEMFGMLTWVILLMLSFVFWQTNTTSPFSGAVSPNHNCHICLLGKVRRLPFNAQTTMTCHP